MCECLPECMYVHHRHIFLGLLLKEEIEVPDGCHSAHHSSKHGWSWQVLREQANKSRLLHPLRALLTRPTHRHSCHFPGNKPSSFLLSGLMSPEHSFFLPTSGSQGHKHSGRGIVGSRVAVSWHAPSLWSLGFSIMCPAEQRQYASGYLIKTTTKPAKEPVSKGQKQWKRHHLGACDFFFKPSPEPLQKHGGVSLTWYYPN